MPSGMSFILTWALNVAHPPNKNTSTSHLLFLPLLCNGCHGMSLSVGLFCTLPLPLAFSLIQHIICHSNCIASSIRIYIMCARAAARAHYPPHYYISSPNLLLHMPYRISFFLCCFPRAHTCSHNIRFLYILLYYLSSPACLPTFCTFIFLSFWHAGGWNRPLQ